MIVILDSNILGLIIAPLSTNFEKEEGKYKQARECIYWFQNLLSRGAYVTVPDICDYEIRRELIRINSFESLDNLKGLRNVINFQELTFNVLTEAAEIWAIARNSNQPNKSIQNIDVDCIIAAHWRLLKNEYPGREVIVATENIKDFQSFSDCSSWKNIKY